MSPQADRLQEQLQASEARHAGEVARLQGELSGLKEQQAAQMKEEQQSHKETAQMLKEVSEQVGALLRPTYSLCLSCINVSHSRLHHNYSKQPSMDYLQCP